MDFQARRPAMHSGLASSFFLFVILALFCPQSVHAQEQFPLFSEFRLGVLAADLDPGGGSDDTVALSGEFLTPRRADRSSSIIEHFFSPRFHVGGIVNLGHGVHQAYAGLTWDYFIADRIFLESSFGGAVHDGGTSAYSFDSFGCTVNFHESFAIGADITETVSILATVDHMSNAGLCDQNQGLTNAGVQLGYRW